LGLRRVPNPPLACHWRIRGAEEHRGVTRPVLHVGDRRHPIEAIRQRVAGQSRDLHDAERLADDLLGFQYIGHASLAELVLLGRQQSCTSRLASRML
jgi:hypothetical protein